MANDRDCENCVHKVNGACTAWECKFEPKRGMADDAISRQAAINVLTKTSGIRGDALKALYELPPVNPQKPCEDAISRQAVLEMATTIQTDDFSGNETIDVVDVNDIKALPPVTLQPKEGWIPVSEGLPKKFSYVNCTCRSLIDDRASWVIETCYVPQPSNSPYSDWGNIPMLNHGECEVIAWMYRDIPKPYKAEGSEE